MRKEKASAGPLRYLRVVSRNLLAMETTLRLVHPVNEYRKTDQK
jgi:hypothetical protein